MFVFSRRPAGTAVQYCQWVHFTHTPGRPACNAPHSLHLKSDHRTAIALRNPTLGRPYTPRFAEHCIGASLVVVRASHRCCRTTLPMEGYIFRYCKCLSFAHGTPHYWMIKRHVPFPHKPHHQSSDYNCIYLPVLFLVYSILSTSYNPLYPCDAYHTGLKSEYLY